MRAEAHIPQADEALRALFTRFKEDPGSAAFEELADALLARGHASEAQIVAEHGLQLDPLNANGHVHRAAAMLALGRARVAYVELVRALAIQPHHPRGMRLLGQVFKDAGLPERAAALLAQRHLGAPTRAPSTVDARPLYEPLPAPKPLPAVNETPATGASVLKTSVPAAPRGLPPISAGKPSSPAKGLMSVESSTEIQDLFASLTKDLGLGGSEQLASRVEVTQVMRLRRMPQEEPREAELSSIDGPIVEATQPGQLQYDEAAPPPADFLFDVVTTPQLSGLGPDEPLFNDVQPLARPADDADTVNEDAPPVLDMGTLQAAIQTEASRKQTDDNPLARRPGEDDDLFGDVAKSMFAGGAEPATREIPYLKRFGRAAREDRNTLPPPGAPTAPPVGDLPGAPAGTALLDRGPKLTIVEKSGGPRTLILAGVGALILAGWLAGIAWVARDSLGVWMGAKQTTVVPSDGPEQAGRPSP